MTATCEFSRYDDPARISAGEEVFLKEDAGAIALFSTSRVVFTGGNMDLNEAFLAQIFQKILMVVDLELVIYSEKQRIL